MAKFYGQINGGRGTATRVGTRNIRASVQSYDGSASLELTYNNNNELMVRVSIAENESSSYGKTIFYGSFNEFVNKFN